MAGECLTELDYSDLNRSDDVRFLAPLADIASALHMSAFGLKRTSILVHRHLPWPTRTVTKKWGMNR